jgi:hypothetical protein
MRLLPAFWRTVSRRRKRRDIYPFHTQPLCTSAFLWEWLAVGTIDRLGIRGLLRRFSDRHRRLDCCGWLGCCSLLTVDWDASLILDIVVGGGSGDAAKKTIAPKKKLNKYDKRRAGAAASRRSKPTTATARPHNPSAAAAAVTVPISCRDASAATANHAVREESTAHSGCNSPQGATLEMTSRTSRSTTHRSSLVKTSQN